MNGLKRILVACGASATVMIGSAFAATITQTFTVPSTPTDVTTPQRGTAPGGSGAALSGSSLAPGVPAILYAIGDAFDQQTILGAETLSYLPGPPASSPVAGHVDTSLLSGNGTYNYDSGDVS